MTNTSEGAAKVKPKTNDEIKEEIKLLNLKPKEIHTPKTLGPDTDLMILQLLVGLIENFKKLTFEFHELRKEIKQEVPSYDKVQERKHV